MEGLLKDIGYGIRMLAKHPGFTAVAVVTLALGIGANSAIFSLANAFLFRPLPYKNTEQLVSIYETNLRLGWQRMGVSLPNFKDWRDSCQVFEQAAAYQERSFNLTLGDKPLRVPGALVSAPIFSLLGIEPIYGRSFLPGEDNPSSERVAVISHALWQRNLGSNPGILGQALKIDGNFFTVVGILPANFKFPEYAELWVPVGSLAGEATGDRGERGFQAVARLKPGVTLGEAQAEIDTIAARLSKAHPETNEQMGASIISLRAAYTEEVEMVFPLLLGAVGFVLLIACANVANLMLARATSRQKEIAIRVAVGASRLRVIRLLLAESLLLAMLGGALGVLLALWAIDLMVAAIPFPIPFWMNFNVDARVLALTLAATILTGVLFGLAPALQASKPDLNEALKEGAMRSATVRGRRLRSFLVVSQVALALVLLSGMGLMLRSFLSAQHMDLGFNPSGVLMTEIHLPEAQYRDDLQVASFYRQALERIGQLPDVESAAASAYVHLGSRGGDRALVVEGHQDDPFKAAYIACEAVSPNYFRALEIPLKRGRYFTDDDARGAAGVIIINEQMARHYWPEEDPLGKQIKLGATDSNSPWLTVVGVVGHIRYGWLSEVDQRQSHQLYVPYPQSASRSMTVVARTRSEPTSAAGAIGDAVLAIDKDQPLYNTRTMEQWVSGFNFPLLAIAALFAVFAAVALVLAAVGVYGMMSYSVSQRTHEIGIRMALGAEPRHVLRLVIGQAMTLALIGVVSGLVAAMALTRVLSFLLYGVSPTDPLTFGSVALLLAAVAIVASYIPARRAAKVEPVVALRHE